MNRRLADVKVRLCVVNIVLGCNITTDRRRLIVNALLPVEDFLLEELQVFTENFNRQTIQVDRLSTRLVHSMRLLLDFFVFEDDVLLDLKHFVAERLDRHQLIIWLRLLNLVKDLEDLMILILHVYQTQFLLFIFANEADKFTTLLNLVQAFDKLVCEVFNPFDVFIFDLDKRVSNALFPFADN